MMSGFDWLKVKKPATISYEHGIESRASIKFEQFLDQLNYYQRLIKACFT
jgi:hypothetical protein